MFLNIRYPCLFSYGSLRLDFSNFPDFCLSLEICIFGPAKSCQKRLREDYARLRGPDFATAGFFVKLL